MTLLAGCLSPEAVRKIEGTPGQEGTGVFLSRLPETIRILATYEASESQAEEARTRARRIFAQIENDIAMGRRKEAPRFLAVQTLSDERTQGKAAMALWDTHTEEIVGNNIYDVEELPLVDQLAMWDGYTALYAGP